MRRMHPVVPGVTVVIPHIPIRGIQLARAVHTVADQTLPATRIIIESDPDHTGSAATRNRALAAVTTEWVAFLDDDDMLYPHHLDELMRCAAATEADVVYPGCDVIGGHDPHDRFGQEFDPDLLRQKSYIPVTSLVRTFYAMHVDGFVRPPGSDYDDWGFYLRLLDAGAKFVHHPVKTWRWFHWGYGMPGRDGNTSGMGNRW